MIDFFNKELHVYTAHSICGFVTRGFSWLHRHHPLASEILAVHFLHYIGTFLIKMEFLWSRRRGNSLSTGGLVNYVWEILFHFIDSYLRASGDSLRKKLLLEALVKTKEAFVSEIVHVSQAYAKYHNYLNHLKKGGSGENKSIGEVRHVLTDWNNAMHPPRGLRLREIIDKANKAYAILLKTLGKGRESLFSAPESLVQYQGIFEKVARCQHIIELEENLADPSPIGVLKKLGHRNFELDVEETDTLKQWVARVNGCWRIDIYKLHRGLKAMSEHIGLSTISKGGQPSQLALLEYHLRARGLTAFNGPDPHYLNASERAAR